MSRSVHNVVPEIAVGEPEREFIFSDLDFRNLVQLAYEYAGIALSDSKRNLVYTRVSRRLRALGLSSFREYRSYLSENIRERENFVNAISTNLTRFFREAHHFEHFSRYAVAPFVAGVQHNGGRFRVWSAGCSTGEEPYSIAAVLKREIRDIGRLDVRVLATDIDTDVLRKGAAGEYPAKSLDDVPRVYRDYFQPAERGRNPANVFATEDIRSLIAFRQLNLMDRWPFQGKFDAIFCRNVMIYFDAATKASLIDRFIQSIKPGGWLYIGHSESFHGTHPELQLVGRTTYRRKP